MAPEFTSRLGASFAADPASNPWRELDGSAVLADISGFTRLTELLEGGGAEGVEVLHRVVTLCFSVLLGRSIELGGDVIAFAGDAALVWFDGDHHVERAVDAASGMPAGLAGLPAAVTGGRRLRVSVGVHTGRFHAVLAGDEQRALFLCGPATSLLSTLQSAAEPGQVLMSTAVAGCLRPSCRGPVLGPGMVLRRRGVANQPPHPSTVAPSPQVDVASFVSPSVLDMFAADVTMGDHRRASAGFVLVPGLDDLLLNAGLSAVHASLDHVVRTVVRITREVSVDWLDSDVGVGSVKLMITAGAPRAIDHDEDRLLLALRRILDECDLPLRAGAQRGRTFTGPLGVPGRRTYTVLGDSVNVAARAVGFAGDRELIAGDGLGVADLSFVSATSLGIHALRNRTHPAELWRVDAVGERPPARPAGASALGKSRSDQALQLAAAWKGAVDGVGCVFEVIGEPGMGATELLAEVADLAGAAATTVVADPYRRHVPYAALGSIVRSLAATSAPEAEDGGWSWIESVAQRLPTHLQSWVPDAVATVFTGETSLLDARSAAQRAQQVLVALLGEVMPRPWLLAINDVEEIDEASRQVIALLRPLTLERPMMLLTTRAVGSPAFGEPFPGTSTIELRPLPVDEARSFVIDLAPSLRDDQIELIVSAGNGNPFVLAELASHPLGTDLPDSLQRLGTTLIDALPVAARASVRDASIFGTSVSAAAVARVLGRPDLATASAWADADPVLRRVDDDTLAFRHEVYRTVAYDALPFQRRRAVHGSIGDDIASGPNPSDALLATHYHRAGRSTQAYPLAERAGRAAKASGALTEAAGLLGMAAGLARVLDRPAAGELLIEQAEALIWLGDLDGGARCLRSAGSLVAEPLLHGRLCHVQADLAITLGRFRRAQRWAERGVSVIAPLGDRAVSLRCQLLLDIAAQLDFAGRHRRSMEPAEQALAIARDARDPLLEGLAHLHLEMSHSALMLPEAVAHGDAAVAIFESIGHDRFLNHALSNSGLTAMYLGRWDDAIDRYERAIVHSRHCGNAISATTAEMNIGFLRFRQGHLEQADAQARHATRAFDAIGLPQRSAFAHLLRGHVAAAEGRFVDAADHVARARSAFVDAEDAAMVVDCDVSTMEHLLVAGRYADVLEAASALSRSISSAEPEVVITFGRVLGTAEAVLHVGLGTARVDRALARARTHQFLYESFLCLTALIAIADGGGRPVTLEQRAERDGIATGLGIERLRETAP